VDAFFGAKASGDFQKFPKFSKNLEKFTIVLEFLGEFSGVSRAAEKWKNNSGIYVRGQFNETRMLFYARI
jgi:hypothetical protein